MAAEEPPAKKARHEPTSAPQRTRGFPHVDGNYATHVYISVAVPAVVQPILQDVVAKAKRDVPTLQHGTGDTSEGAASSTEEYHISLSHVVPTRFRDKDSLLAGLRDALAKTKTWPSAWAMQIVCQAFAPDAIDRCPRCSFQVSLTRLEVLVNEQRTRTFLALSASQGREQVCKAIARVNRVFLQHGLPPYHKDPKPHVSFAWAPSDEQQPLEAHLQRLGSTGEGVAGRSETWQQQVTSIECKIGKQVLKVWRHTA